MNDVINEFIAAVSEKDEFQQKRLEKLDINDFERSELAEIINFFIEKKGYSMDYISDAYVFINQMVMEETYYFLSNGHYRYSSFEEVDSRVYGDSEYMSKYMCGLSIANYIWKNHVYMLRFYDEIMRDCVENEFGKYAKWVNTCSNKRYLEIGPGFGQYLIRSLRSNKFSNV